MNRIFVHGCGVVSPAGWGVTAFREALVRGESVPAAELSRPGWESCLQVRTVPSAQPRPGFFNHARLRRTSAISRYAVAAALEALGDDAELVRGSPSRLGIVLCVMSGCVNYSQRFYDETLKDPATASPLVFPETVFNAPASHVAAVVGATGINYTLVGDPGTFLKGLALAADWLVHEEVDGCLVIGAEESDWLTADAFRLFSRRIVLSEGAGAVYLRREAPAGSSVCLHCITGPHPFFCAQSRTAAAAQVRAELPSADAKYVLCDGRQELRRLDAAEAAAWQDWPGARLSPKTVLGEGLMAAAAWQCVAAIDALRDTRYSAAHVSIVGCNQQAIGASFARVD